MTPGQRSLVWLHLFEFIITCGYCNYCITTVVCTSYYCGGQYFRPLCVLYLTALFIINCTFTRMRTTIIHVLSRSTCPVLSRAGSKCYSITTNGYGSLTPSNPHITILVTLDAGRFDRTRFLDNEFLFQPANTAIRLPLESLPLHLEQCLCGSSLVGASSPLQPSANPQPRLTSFWLILGPASPHSGSLRPSLSTLPRLVFGPASVVSFRHSSPRSLHLGTARFTSAPQQLSLVWIATKVFIHGTGTYPSDKASVQLHGFSFFVAPLTKTQTLTLALQPFRQRIHICFADTLDFLDGLTVKPVTRSQEVLDMDCYIGHCHHTRRNTTAHRRIHCHCTRTTRQHIAGSTAFTHSSSLQVHHQRSIVRPAHWGGGVLWWTVL